jgi:F0F1-type ATP synthase epsilon subunit
MFKLNSSPPRTISLTVRNRTKILFRGEVKAVTSVNAKGRFDILAEHANFLSIITDYLIIHTLEGTKQEIKLKRGVLKVSGKIVNVYLGVVHASTEPAPHRQISAFQK